MTATQCTAGCLPLCAITEALALVQRDALRSCCKLPHSKVPACQRMSMCPMQSLHMTATQHALQAACWGSPPHLHTSATPEALKAPIMNWLHCRLPPGGMPARRLRPSAPSGAVLRELCLPRLEGPESRRSSEPGVARLL